MPARPLITSATRLARLSVSRWIDDGATSMGAANTSAINTRYSRLRLREWGDEGERVSFMVRHLQGERRRLSRFSTSRIATAASANENHWNA